MLAAIDRQSGCTEFAPDDGGILHVKAHQLLHFRLASVGIDRLGTTLDDVADAVELGALAPVPEAPELHRVAIGGFAFQTLGHHGEGTAGAGEASVLGEGAELDRTVAGSLELKDRMGQCRILDEGLIGRIEQDQGAMAAGVIDPGLELLLGGNGPGGIVGEAEIDQVNRLTGNLRGKAVVGADRQIGQAPVTAAVIGVPGATSHHVAVHIHRINGVGDGHAVAIAKDVENVAAVALRAIGDEDLVGTDVAAASLEIVFGNRLPQPSVTLLRAVTVEAFGGAHRIDGALHRLAAGQGQRFGHIADSQTDQRSVGVGGAEGLHPAADFGEQVARLELEVAAVDLHHGTGGVSLDASCPVDCSIR